MVDSNLSGSLNPNIEPSNAVVHHSLGSLLRRAQQGAHGAQLLADAAVLDDQREHIDKSCWARRDTFIHHLQRYMEESELWKDRLGPAETRSAEMPAVSDQ